MLRSVLIPLIVGMVVTLAGGNAGAQRQPEGQLVIAFDTSIAATYFDPAETPGLQTPFVFLYALHDALVKPLPGNDMAPCLAESWSESPDGLVYEFKLREGVTFHNGDPFTAEDVKFSFLRYKGTSAKQRHERVQAVEVVDAHRLRFVRSDPGVELVLEANERYWRKVPSIKRIIYKGIPESPTRLAMLKTGEADIAYLMYREEGRAVPQDPKLRLVRSMPPVTWSLDFPAQWDPKSPWHDRRVRLAASDASTGRRSTKWSGLAEAG
jgi:peptide/nickel transport system substrate-binding protein